MIAIVNYGLGNLGSVQNMLSRLGFTADIVSDPSQLIDATKIILPGVGAFDTGMRHLMDDGWMDILNRKVLDEKVPTLGICLGMQLMTSSSEEGKLPGLGWIKGATKRFDIKNPRLKVPHMGWNTIRTIKPSKLLPQDEIERRFYFVHSYYVKTDAPDDALLNTTYENEFCSGFERENIIGVQFHPEKSHRFGMELLGNFASKF